MRVILAGGGTGGHIYPAIAIAQAIIKKDPNSKILFLGSQGGMEATLVPQAGFNIETINLEGWQRKISLQAFRAGWKGILGAFAARKIIAQFKPDVVIGTGGFVCGPVVLIAAMMGINTLIHEQNALPGLTNRHLSRWVDKCLVNFPESKEVFPQGVKEKIKITGLPVRPTILNADKKQGLEKLQLAADKVTILVTGGSRGARSINNAMLGVAKALYQDKRVQIIHITGQDGYQSHLNNLEKLGLNGENLGNIIIKPYLHDMHLAIAAADLCIARAGATFLAEITALGVPAILVPYPFASENHQEFNAKALVNNGAAKMILDKSLTPENLLLEIEGLLSHPLELEKMSKASRKMGKPNAINDILREIGL